MDVTYTLGDDGYAFLPVNLQVLSSYESDGRHFVELCLTEQAYKELKEFFRRELAGE